jgi:uncharacterized protein (DUF2267 family)
MSATGLDVFDKTIQETNRWLRLVMDVLETPDRRLAFAALRATLHALRDRIGPANAAHLGAQLPMLLRGAYYEGWRPTAPRAPGRHAEDFLDSVASELRRGSDLDPLEAAQATFMALAVSVDPQEYRKLMQELPAELRLLSLADAASGEGTSEVIDGQA